MKGFSAVTIGTINTNQQPSISQLESALIDIDAKIDRLRRSISTHRAVLNPMRPIPAASSRNAQIQHPDDSLMLSMRSAVREKQALLTKTESIRACLAIDLAAARRALEATR